MNSGAEVVYALPPTVEAPALARRYVEEHARAIAPQLRDDAMLLVSEIVTNAVRYGRGEIVLRLKLDPPSIGVAVHDDGDDIVTVPSGMPDVSATSGRGLLIVAAVASAWGVTPASDSGGTGKTVWFELSAAE